MTRTSGFTLLELLIVVAVIAILATIAIPNLTASRIRANEAAVIATLKQIATSQAQIKSSAVIDADRDGVGEHGYFQEMTGLRPVRLGKPPGVIESKRRVSPPVLSAAFTDLQPIGPYSIVLRSGYYFVMSLPDPGANWLPERQPTTPYGPVGPNRAENFWSCHAWPVSYGRSGQRIFFINQGGDLLAADNAVTKYSGLNRAINIPGILLKSSPPKTRMDQSIAINATGNDGNIWKVVN